MYVVYIWKWSSANALGGVCGVTSFITTDEQLQLNRDCCFLVQAMLPEGFLFISLNNMAPLYMTDVVSFSKNDQNSLRSVKHNDLVLKKKPNTQFFKDSFSYYSLSIWNEIPFNIRNSPSIQSFKYLYRNYLFKKNWFFVLQLYMFSL